MGRGRRILGRPIALGLLASRTRTLDPGQRACFPVLRAPRHRISFEQRSGAGVLRARLRIEFGRGAVPSHCYPYAPPRIDLQVKPL